MAATKATQRRAKMAATQKISYDFEKAYKLLKNACSGTVLSERKLDSYSIFEEATYYLQRALYTVEKDIFARYNTLKEERELSEATHKRCAKRASISYYLHEQLLNNFDTYKENEVFPQFSEFYELYSSSEEFMNYLLLTIAEALTNTHVKNLRISQYYRVRTSKKAIEERNFNY